MIESNQVSIKGAVSPISVSQVLARDTCDLKAIATDDLQELLNGSLPIDKAQKMAEFFGMLGDPNRLRILSIRPKQRRIVPVGLLYSTRSIRALETFWIAPRYGIHERYGSGIG